METTPAKTNQYLLKAAHLTVTTSSSEIKNNNWSKNRWYSTTNIADVSSRGSWQYFLQLLRPKQQDITLGTFFIFFQNWTFTLLPRSIKKKL